MSNYQIVKALHTKHQCLRIVEQSESTKEVELAMRLLDAIQAKLNERSN